MPTTPEVKQFTPSKKTTQKILTAIYANSSEQFKAKVPEFDYRKKSTLTISNLRAFGTVLQKDVNLRNDFIGALVNRIGNVIVQSKLYDNPWAFLKNGVMELGEVIEDVFIEMASPKKYSAKDAEDTIFKRHLPDVKSAFYRMNYEYYYPTTIQNVDLRQAFLSWDGVSKFISDAVTQLYTGANYDEYVCTKFMLINAVIQGKLFPVTIPQITDKESIEKAVIKARAATSNLTFMSRKYNQAGVRTISNYDDMYLFIDSDFEAKMDVSVLASAFNMEKADFLSKRVLVDGFGNIDKERLMELFGDNPDFELPDDETLEALSEIPMLLIDKRFFMILDNFIEMNEVYNNRGLYWNYNLHVWKTFAISPFANAVMFLPFEQDVTAITVIPNKATVMQGQSIVFGVDVEAEGFAQRGLTWGVSGNTDTSTEISAGTLFVGDDETGTLTVTATSTYDTTVSGSSTVTVVAVDGQ